MLLLGLIIAISSIIRIVINTNNRIGVALRPLM